MTKSPLKVPRFRLEISQQSFEALTGDELEAKIKLLAEARCFFFTTKRIDIDKEITK